MDLRVPVYCSFSKEVYDAGDVVTALIRAPACPEAVVYAQAVGVLQVDGRWVKVPTKYYDGGNIIAASSYLPESMKNNSYTNVLTFSTTLEPLAYSHICDEGVYVQFEIPCDTLPTFIGIAGSIAYFINVTIQFPTQTLRCHFGYRVFGSGSTTLCNKRRGDITDHILCLISCFIALSQCRYLQRRPCHIAPLLRLMQIRHNPMAIVMTSRTWVLCTEAARPPRTSLVIKSPCARSSSSPCRCTAS
jgi:hypothetical protein